MGTFIVTGGGGPGIGSACCHALADLGHHIWVADIDAEAARTVAASLGTRGSAITMDVADPESVQAGIAHALAESGRVDGLVNSAGITVQASITEWSVNEFDRLIKVNLRGAWLCCRAVIPGMVTNGGGTIVNIGSVHAHKAEPLFGIYAASKAGLVAMTRAIAGEYGASGVRCNSVSPGWVTLANRSPARAREISGHVRIKQMVPVPIEPQDIAAVVAFLASESARAITAVDIAVDGGRTAMLRHRESAELTD